MITTEVTRLVERWRDEITRLRTRYRDEDRARMLELAADELESAIRDTEREVLTLDESVEYSGYSRSHLRALRDEGKLTQAGQKGDPRFFRVELPVKPGHNPPPTVGVHVSTTTRRRRRKR